MAKVFYIGVSGTARKIKKAYIGVNNTAREITDGYIGVNTLAYKFYSSEPVIPYDVNLGEDIQAFIENGTFNGDKTPNLYEEVQGE